jgi:hypothetical protein
MRKTFTNTLMIAATVLALSGAAAFARQGGGHGGQGGNHGGGQQSSPPSAPSAPSAAPGIPGDTDTSAGRTNFAFAIDGTVRPTMNPGFCDRNPNDYFVGAGLAVCVGY